jgi:hypothetical protein
MLRPAYGTRVPLRRQPALAGAGLEFRAGLSLDYMDSFLNVKRVYGFNTYETIGVQT